MDKFAAALHVLRRTYIKDLWQREDVVLDALAKLDADQLVGSHLSALEVAAHKLVGTGRTYQFPQISEAARVVEDLVRDGQSFDKALLHPALLHLLECCAQAREQFEQEDVEIDADAEHDQFDAIEAVDAPTLPSVLIIDDDPQTRDLLKQFISEYARCTLAEDSAHAEHYMAEQAFDLVLLDNKMPGEKSGLDLLKQIKASPDLRHMDVVMITASGEPHAVLESLTAGAADYVIKPFDAEVVARKLKTRLNHLQQTIMLVDDDPAVQNLLTAKFRTLGVKCVTFDDGLVALDEMDKVNPDLIILDRILPGLEGMAVLHKTLEKENFKDTPVVMLSAKRDNKDIMMGLQFGAADYVVKPFNLDELVLRCQRLLERSTLLNRQQDTARQA
ncbi:response regulator [Maritalea sp. P4.10X]|uniref:Response regulator n=2 Tax=Maritalea mediterranea TaxID=2909667 RepID=A0ABS9E326_9HYPH|nr:response regulator [Maritalea mediterranea]